MQVYRDPAPPDLEMFLHALRYTGRGWSFETEARHRLLLIGVTGVVAGAGLGPGGLGAAGHGGAARPAAARLRPAVTHCCSPLS